MSIPKPPAGAGAAGRRLWRAVMTDYELDDHEAVLLVQACRVADTCEDLQAIAAADGPMLDGKVHPALVELRQQRIVLARLVVALRVPIGDQENPSQNAAPRLQRRGARGVYGIRGTVA